MSVYVYVSCVLKEANSKYRGETRFFFPYRYYHEGEMNRKKANIKPTTLIHKEALQNRNDN